MHSLWQRLITECIHRLSKRQNEQSYMLVYNSKGRIVLATDNASKYLGFSRNELMSLTIPEISPKNQLYTVSDNADDAALKSWDKYHKQLTSDIVHYTKKGEELQLKAEFTTVASTTDYYAVGLYKVLKSSEATNENYRSDWNQKLHSLSAIIPFVPIL